MGQATKTSALLLEGMKKTELVELVQRLQETNEKLTNCLRTLVDNSVMNIGTEHEYITMSGADALSGRDFFERSSCDVWKMWDCARMHLGGRYTRKQEE